MKTMKRLLGLAIAIGVTAFLGANNPAYACGNGQTCGDESGLQGATAGLWSNADAFSSGNSTFDGNITGGAATRQLTEITQDNGQLSVRQGAFSESFLTITGEGVGNDADFASSSVGEASIGTFFSSD